MRSLLAIAALAACTHAPTPPPPPALDDAKDGPLIDEVAIDAFVAKVSREHADAPPLAFTHVAVVSIAHPGVDADQTIVVRDGKIVAVGPAATTPVPAGITAIDGTGRYAMPGLTDMHVHTELSTSNYLLDLANGVTSVREMNGSPWLLAMRDRARHDLALIPNLYVAGPILAAMQFADAMTVVATPEAARAEVRRQAAAGYEFIKVHNVVPAPIYAAICEEARAHHLDVIGHIPHDTTIAKAIECVQRTFEHFKSYIDDHTLTLTHEDYVAVTRGAEVWNTPTFATYRSNLRGDEARRVLALPEMRYVPARDRAAWLALAAEPANPVQQGVLPLSEKIFRDLLPIGSHFLAGTDSGGGYPFMVRGFALHDELRIMAEQGMPIADVLRTATIEPQRAMRRDEAGTIEVGKRADLVLLRANPLAAIANASAIDGVMVRGIWLDRRALDAILDGIALIYAAHAAPTNADLERAKRTENELRARGIPLRTRAW